MLLPQIFLTRRYVLFFYLTHRIFTPCFGKCACQKKRTVTTQSITELIINCCLDCFGTELYGHLTPSECPSFFLPLPPSLWLPPPLSTHLIPPLLPLHPGERLAWQQLPVTFPPEVTSQHRRASQCDPPGTTRCSTATVVGTTSLLMGTSVPWCRANSCSHSVWRARAGIELLWGNGSSARWSWGSFSSSCRCPFRCTRPAHPVRQPWPWWRCVRAFCSAYDLRHFTALALSCYANSTMWCITDARLMLNSLVMLDTKPVNLAPNRFSSHGRDERKWWEWDSIRQQSCQTLARHPFKLGYDTNLQFDSLYYLDSLAL